MLSGITYQNQKRQEIKDPPEIYFATVLGVYEDGLNLIFDGESESINKRYRYNKSITFKIGDRVKVTKVSGTYLVEYPIGKMTVSLAPGNIKMMSYQFGDKQLSVTWTDPDDTVIDGVTVSRWAGTYLVRNEINYPKNETDGTVVLNSKTRNAYSSTPYIDSGLQNGKQYYYALFPYSDDGKVNRNPENRLGGSPNAPKRYGVRIDKKNSDPDTRVEYLFDAIGKKPARINAETGLFDYGDWADVGFVKDNKPCMLRKDGTVDYYLNPSNWDQKDDGTPSNISDSSYDGNAMAEFPLWWMYQYQDSDYDYIIISDSQIDNNYHAYAFTDSNGIVRDKMYVGIYRSSSSGQSLKGLSQYYFNSFSDALTKHTINNIYNLISWSERDYIASLLIILSKSTDFAECFGATPLQSQASESQFGASNVFYIQRYWQNNYFISGIIEIKDGVSFYIYTKMTPPYNTDGTEYENTDIDFIYNYSGKYIKEISINGNGKIPTSGFASSTAYYTSSCRLAGSNYDTLLYPMVYEGCTAMGINFYSDGKGGGRLSCHP